MRPDPWASDGQTILLVDDEPDVRESIVDILEATLPGVRLLSAPTAEDGLQLLSRHRVDLVVSDYRLPGMDGLRFLKAALLQAPQAPRFLVTGHAEMQVPVEALNAARIEAIVTKPIDASQLVARIRTALQRSTGRTPRLAGRNVRGP